MTPASIEVTRVLLLGGTSQIGLQTIQSLFLWHPISVHLAGRSALSLDAVAHGLQAIGVKEVDYSVCDFSRLDEVETFAQRLSTTTTFDIILVAVGENPDSNFDAARIARTNFLGPAVFLNEYLNSSRLAHCTVVVLSSFASVRPRASNYTYGASKRALEFFTQGLGEAFPDLRIRTVRMGKVQTRMSANHPRIPLEVSAEDAGVAICRSMLGRRTLVWIPRRLVLFAMFSKFIPVRLWRYLDRKWARD